MNVQQLPGRRAGPASGWNGGKLVELPCRGPLRTLGGLASLLLRQTRGRRED